MSSGIDDGEPFTYAAVKFQVKKLGFPLQFTYFVSLLKGLPFCFFH